MLTRLERALGIKIICALCDYQITNIERHVSCDNCGSHMHFQCYIESPACATCEGKP